MNRLRNTIKAWWPAAGIAGLTLATAAAIANAVLKVDDWTHDDEQRLACCSPEPGCPSPFPGICEDS